MCRLYWGRHGAYSARALVLASDAGVRRIEWSIRWNWRSRRYLQNGRTRERVRHLLRGMCSGFIAAATVSKTNSSCALQAILLGMSLAPAVGGIMAHYYSWRATQYGLFVAGFVSLILTWLFQPETCQPGTRGVDKLISSEGKARWVWLNPFESVALLRSPNVLFIVSVYGLPSLYF